MTHNEHQSKNKILLHKSNKYLAIVREESGNGSKRYLNVIDRDNISNTIKLDLFTNTALANFNINRWEGFFAY